MKLYSTLTRNIENLKPLNPPHIGVYTCGPTVYDYAHIGHWFNYVRMDTLIRALKASGLTPTWVMNITDVGHLVSDADEGEDKLEKGAKREGKTAWEVAEFYTQNFLSDMKKLGIVTPDHIVRATEHITEQIALIQKLEQKGFTYVIDDGVYYDTAQFPEYAHFAKLDLEEQQEGARVAVNTQKRNATDFALWKFSPQDIARDMEWDSPWGKGFPGWHIECSAMSMKYLGDTLDIHTGGIDHIPVHHTNEIAQSEAATGKRFANYWMHSNHVTVNGEKISKSLGNGIRLDEILERGISPESVRLHILESHYRSQSRFSWENLTGAHNRLAHLLNMAALRWQAISIHRDHSSYFKDQAEALIRAMQHDLNSPEALVILSAVASKVENDLISSSELEAFEHFLQTADMLFELGFMRLPDISAEQQRLIADRETARKNKDWDASDMLREELKQHKVIVRDTSAGTIWSPVL